MPKRKQSESVPSKPKAAPAMTPEARENQLIALAVDCAEEQLRNGTASSQVICHYLKLGSTRERIEKEMLEKKVELMTAQKESLESTQRIEELYKKAMDYMRLYSGNSRRDDEDD